MKILLYFQTHCTFSGNLNPQPTFLELLEHDIERGVDEDEVAGILVELAECLEWGVVVGVNEGEVLDEEHRDNVGAFTLVHRHTRVSWIIKEEKS